MDLTIFSTSDMTESKKEAVELHFEIKKNGEFAAAALVEFCKGLKKMRDKRLYCELGFDVFEEYVEKAVGIKQRQAYTYIQALENLGESVLQSTAKFGITKLSLLCEIPRNERADFIEQNNIEEMSARELKDAIAKATAAEEQLTFIVKENEKLKKDNAELEKELKIEKNKPVSVSVREPSAEEIAALTQNAVAEAEKKLKAVTRENQKEIDALKSKKEKEISELTEKHKSELAAIEKERDIAEIRLAEFKKSSKLQDDPVIMKFSFYFEEAQKNINNMRSIIENSDNATAEKLQNALNAIIALLKG